MLAPFWDGIGGAETFAKALYEELSKVHEVQVVKSDFKRTWAGTSLGNFWTVFPQILKKSFWKARKVDIILANGLISATIGCILRFLRKNEVRVVLLALYEFKGRSAIFRFLARQVLLRYEKVYVEGQNGAQDILDIFIPPSKIRIFNHWVDQDVFKPIERTNKKLQVLFVGRPIQEKGIQIIKDIETKMRYIKNVEFTYVENVPYQNLPRYYQMADLLVVPSLYSEGFVRVVAEGASCGCVVIATNMGSLPEMVNPFGIIVPPPYALGFYLEIEKFYNGFYTLDLWREATIEYAKQNFSPKNAEIFL